TAAPRVFFWGLKKACSCLLFVIFPPPVFDPFVSPKGGFIIGGGAAKRRRVGISHPAGLFPHCDDAEERYRLALRSKNIGFAGVMCPDPSWVEPCNRALTPSDERLVFYRETRRLFAEGIPPGTAPIPYPRTTI